MAFAQLDALFEERIGIIDGAMGTSIQKYKLDEDDYRGERYKVCLLPRSYHNPLLHSPEEGLSVAAYLCSVGCCGKVSDLASLVHGVQVEANSGSFAVSGRVHIYDLVSCYCMR